MQTRFPLLAAIPLSLALAACSSEATRPMRTGIDPAAFDNHPIDPVAGTSAANPLDDGTNGDPSAPGPVVVTPGGPAGDGDEGFCADAMIEPRVTGGPGNLLVIFDRSSSMNNIFQGSQTRIDAVHEALEAAIAPFLCPPQTEADSLGCVEKLTVGALLFPSSDGGGRGFGGLAGTCPVDPLTADTQIDWMLATPFIEAWRAYWQGPNGMLYRGTPIPAAFQQAEAALTALTLDGSTTVLFLTDGESNCMTGVDPVMQATIWLGRGIPTYVVSVAPGVSAFNEQVAQAGGTMMSITPTDTQQLTDTLSNILEATVRPVSCLVELDGTPIRDLEGACEKGEVLLGPTLLACDPTDGFQVRSENQIEVMGSACDKLMEGTTRLSAKFPCEVLLL